MRNKKLVQQNLSFTDFVPDNSYFLLNSVLITLLIARISAAEINCLPLNNWISGSSDRARSRKTIRAFYCEETLFLQQRWFYSSLVILPHNKGLPSLRPKISHVYVTSRQIEPKIISLGFVSLSDLISNLDLNKLGKRVSPQLLLCFLNNLALVSCRWDQTGVGPDGSEQTR